MKEEQEEKHTVNKKNHKNVAKFCKGEICFLSHRFIDAYSQKHVEKNV